jgi:restriction endonuclease
MQDQDEYLSTENRKNLFRAKRIMGYNVVLPDDCTLQLDIDTEEDYETFKKILRMLNAKVEAKYTVVSDKPSKSGLPKRHITIKSTRTMSLWEKVALQASLGSDRKREALNAARVIAGVEDPIAFFEKA